MSASRTARAIDTLLEAIESRDLRAIEATLAPAATWQNVPQYAHVGRDAVVALLAGIVTWSDRVRWEIVSASYDGDTGWLERVDRFWIDGREHAVRCNGVFAVDTEHGLVSGVRDYVDLGEWRSRIGPAFDAMANRSPDAVVARHTAAVERRDVVAMAADYALDAELVRGGHVHRGWRAIADYFDTVPERLAGRTISFGSVAPTAAADHGAVSVPWTISAGDTVVASGHDELVLVAGRIVRQTVHLDGDDF